MKQYEFNVRRILSYTRRAVEDYSMINDSDCVAIGLSGGKDSLALLCALANLKKFYPKSFTIKALHIDMGFHKLDNANSQQTKQSIENMRQLCNQLEVEFILKETEIAKIIFDVRKEKNPCSLCARMRRGAIHELAKENGCNVLAFGHHFDDAVETFIMNLFNEGRIGCFSPVTYLSRRDLTLIRPLIYAPEKDIRYFINHSDLPVFSSPCPSDQNTDRQKIKNCLKEWEKQNKGLKHRIFGAMQKGEIDGFKLCREQSIDQTTE